jgi:Ca2+-binding RTX toxin-like protein
VLHVQGGGTVNLSGVTGVANLTFAGHDTVDLTNADFTGTAGLIVVTDLGGNNTIDGAAVTGSHNLIIHGASGDTLTAGGGDNFLVAGAGSEILIGGGATGFELTSATGKATIQRFSATADQLVFSDAAFNLGVDDGKGKNLTTPEQLAASVFSSAANGTFASTQNRFAYNTSTGVLYYSADGKNADRVSIATLSGHPGLKAQDLFFLS